MLSGMLLQISSIMINNVGLLSLKFLLSKNSFFVVTKMTHAFSFVILLLVAFRFRSYIFNKHVPVSKVAILTFINILGNISFLASVQLAHPVYVALFGRSFIVFNIFFSVFVLKEKLRLPEIPLTILAIFGMFLFQNSKKTKIQTFLKT